METVTGRPLWNALGAGVTSESFTNQLQWGYGTFHNTAVPVIGLTLGFLVLIIAMGLAGPQKSMSAASLGKILCAVGFVQFLFSAPIIFSVNWQYSMTWMLMSACAINAGKSAYMPAAYFSAVMHFLGFFQAVATFFIVTGNNFALADRFDQMECRVWYGYSSDLTTDLSNASTRQVDNRCDARTYLQFLRIMCLFINCTMFLCLMLSSLLITKCHDERNKEQGLVSKSEQAGVAV